MEEEREELKNVIGGKHTINKNQGALSLIRKFDADHAYLVLELIGDDNERIIMDAHLVVKEGSNDKKADIVYRDISDRLEELTQIGQSCSSYTWNITGEKASRLMELIQSEQQRAQKNEINYILWGKSKVSGSFVSLPEDMKTSLGEHSDNMVSNALLREGHNCGSWAIAMVRELGLPFKGNYVPFLFFSPKSQIKGHHDGDNFKEPETNCRIM